MEGLNRVLLLGNLGADPELRATGSGQAVLKMRLATSETYLDRDKKRAERTEWHSVVVWGKRAEGLGKILRKGERVLVEGRLQTSSWEDRGGQKRYRTEVVADEVLLQGSPGGSKGARPSRSSEDDREPADSEGPSDFPDDDDIPF